MNTSQKTGFNNTGFTLLELMIVVVIMAILMIIALPSYQRYVTRAHMQEAKAKLSENYLYLERMYNKNNGYVLSKGGATIKANNLPIKQAGQERTAYKFTVTAGCSDTTDGTTATSFCLKATPESAQLSASGGGKECGTLAVDQSGQYYIKPKGSSNFSSNTRNGSVVCF